MLVTRISCVEDFSLQFFNKCCYNPSVRLSSVEFRDITWMLDYQMQNLDRILWRLRTGQTRMAQKRAQALRSHLLSSSENFHFVLYCLTMKLLKLYAIYQAQQPQVISLSSGILSQTWEINKIGSDDRLDVFSRNPVNRQLPICIEPEIPCKQRIRRTPFRRD